VLRWWPAAGPVTSAACWTCPPSLFGEEAPVNVGAALIVVALTAVAVLGIRESARVTTLLVVVKVTVCVFVIVAGAWFVRGANLTPFVPEASEPVAFGIGGVLTAAAVVFSSYTGFEAVANLSEETRRPGRDLPLGLFGTLGIATVLYVGVSLVVVGMIPYDRIDPGPRSPTPSTRSASDGPPRSSRSPRWPG
jgi:APA family basic amino acid/polyamine antiporter